jgi:predicted nuclease of predicted toxin-antitoxin system
MKMLADESVDGAIVQHLRSSGHDVIYVAEVNAGISDDEVLELANRMNALLWTHDKDFGELIFRLQRMANGVVLVRLAGCTSSEKVAIVDSAMQHILPVAHSSFSVITKHSVRIRPLVIT